MVGRENGRALRRRVRDGVGVEARAGVKLVFVLSVSGRATLFCRPNQPWLATWFVVVRIRVCSVVIKVYWREVVDSCVTVSRREALRCQRTFEQTHWDSEVEEGEMRSFLRER